ncbi:MAG: pseudouridine synthase [Betaproteobacteria bacterium]|nr:pseudouridine synthase [Betaproteobacteria bacterium]
MSMLLLFNKPYGVICQFSASGSKPTLKDYIPVPDVYPAGRLDTDSEGLIVLTDDGRLQAKITDPHHKLSKTYWVQVEGAPTDDDLNPLRQGLDLGDFTSLAARAKILPSAPTLWKREPPIRFRQHIPTQWLEITLEEGKNRQIRRMTAKIGFPTLRLVRVAIGPWGLGSLSPGQWRNVFKD